LEPGFSDHHLKNLILYQEDNSVSVSIAAYRIALEREVDIKVNILCTINTGCSHIPTFEGGEGV
jgi:hypothetical protein